MIKNLYDFKNECADNEIEEAGQLYNHVEYMFESETDDFLTNLMITDLDIFIECMNQYFLDAKEFTKSDFEKIIKQEEELSKKQKELLKLTALGSIVSDECLTIEDYDILIGAEEKIPEQITPWAIYEFFSLEELQEKVTTEEKKLKRFFFEMKKSSDSNV